jgi:DNA-binding beta-propeller fold protein YncE
MVDLPGYMNLDSAWVKFEARHGPGSSVSFPRSSFASSPVNHGLSIPGLTSHFLSPWGSMKHGIHLPGRWPAWLTATACVATIVMGPSAHAAPIDPPTAANILMLPHAGGRIAFDDMRYLPALQRVAVPAAQTGDVDLIDPRTEQTTVIAGAAGQTGAQQGEDPGATSVDFGDGYLFIGDHTHTDIAVVDPRTKQVVSRVPLAADYDFVRFVPQSKEVWVTEPDQHRIEIFQFDTRRSPHLIHDSFIVLPDGPEALAIDDAHSVAYTNSRTNHTFVISLNASHAIVRWRNSCVQSRGLAVGAHLVFVGCKEGKVLSLDTRQKGRLVGTAAVGPGVDLLAFNSRLHHVYVPSSADGTLTVLNVSAAGALHRLATYRTAPGAHCVVTDNQQKIYVCDPAKGALLVFRDRP